MNSRTTTCLSCQSRSTESQSSSLLTIWETTGLLPLLQSALLDVLTAVDDKITSLVLLDLSAIFDRVDHDILLSRLQSMFGLDGGVLAWQYFLTEPSVSVSMVVYLQR